MALTGVTERDNFTRKNGGFVTSASAPQLEIAGRADAAEAAPATQAHIPRKPDKNWSQVPLGDTRSCLLPEKQAARAAAKQERELKMNELLKTEIDMKSRSAP